MMKRRRRGMGMLCVSSSASGYRSSIYLTPGTFCCWSSAGSCSAGRVRISWPTTLRANDTALIRWRISDDRHHLAPLRHLSLFGESPARLWAQRPRLGIGRASPDHAETESEGADGRLLQDAGSADWRGHLATAN